MTAQMCTLYLVRHGQTQWNIDKIIQGHTDIHLTKTGENQAHKLREKLKNIAFSKIYSSDLIRAHRTAEILNLEQNVVLQATQVLRERNFGLYEGKPIEKGKEKLWDLLAQYSDGHPHLQKSKVETNKQMISRIITFLREISITHSKENILVVTHGGVMRQVLIYFGFAQLPSGSIQNLAYIKLQSDGLDFIVKETDGITFESK